jgi:hypothetical protein
MWGDETRVQDLVLKYEGKRPLERPRYKWEDNIKMHLNDTELEGVD